MTNKNIAHVVKMQVVGGNATPGPQMGSKLGSKGVKPMEFCKAFNAQTQDKKGQELGVIISVYEDKSFDFVIKNPPVAVLIKKVLSLEKGSGEPNRNKIAQLTQTQVRDIALLKQEELGAFTIEAAMKIVAGTARSMGITTNGNG